MRCSGVVLDGEKGGTEELSGAGDVGAEARNAA
jgi:hypothetical protein